MFRQQILSLISGWASYKSRKTTDASHLIHKLILDEIPNSLKDWTPSSQEFKFQGSDGQGNILSAPWVAFLIETSLRVRQRGITLFTYSVKTSSALF